MKNKFLNKYIGLVYIAFIAIAMSGCVQEPSYFPKGSDQLVIADYVLTHPDKFGEFGKLLESTKLSSILSVRGPYTLFLPTDEAMKAYYKELGVTSLDELDAQTKMDLVYNHLVATNIKAGDIGLGALRDTNALGDFIVTEFQGRDIVLNKESKIVNQDVVTANGYIQVIDKVIKPLTLSVYDKLVANPAFSIFAEGLKRTRLKDTLSIIKFIYNPTTGRQARNRYTLFAVPDTLFKRFGINNIDQLIAKYTGRPDSITFLNNGFYRYMEYHCLTETYYLSTFSKNTQVYPILSRDNNVSVTIDTDYKINYDTQTKQYTGFYVSQSNIPAKNGAIHTVNGLMPVYTPARVTFEFETTDYLDIKQGEWYQKHYMKWPGSVGLTQFAKIKFQGDYLQYYYKLNQYDLVKNDMLNMNGYFWCEITTPKIMKGKWTLTGGLWTNWCDYVVYVDGKKYNTIAKSAAYKSTWADLNFETTQEHKIKIVNTTWGILFWDRVIFTPVR